MKHEVIQQAAQDFWDKRAEQRGKQADDGKAGEKPVPTATLRGSRMPCGISSSLAVSRKVMFGPGGRTFRGTIASGSPGTSW